VAGLACNGRVYTTGIGGTIGERKGAVRDALTRLGFTGVRSDDIETAGGKGLSWLNVVHYPINPPFSFWEVVSCADPNGYSAAKALVDAVLSEIGTVHPFVGGGGSDK
jgi:hypothetical protein